MDKRLAVACVCALTTLLFAVMRVDGLVALSILPDPALATRWMLAMTVMFCVHHSQRFEGRLAPAAKSRIPIHSIGRPRARFADPTARPLAAGSLRGVPAT